MYIYIYIYTYICNTHTTLYISFCRYAFTKGGLLGSIFGMLAVSVSLFMLLLCVRVYMQVYIHKSIYAATSSVFGMLAVSINLSKYMQINIHTYTNTEVPFWACLLSL